jgi:hypothetical protein
MEGKIKEGEHETVRVGFPFKIEPLGSTKKSRRPLEPLKVDGFRKEKRKRNCLR